MYILSPNHFVFVCLLLLSFLSLFLGFTAVTNMPGEHSGKPKFPCREDGIVFYDYKPGHLWCQSACKGSTHEHC